MASFDLSQGMYRKLNSALYSDCESVTWNTWVILNKIVKACVLGLMYV